jgi:hypothetical protein
VQTRTAQAAGIRRATHLYVDVFSCAFVLARWVLFGKNWPAPAVLLRRPFHARRLRSTESLVAKEMGEMNSIADQECLRRSEHVAAFLLAVAWIVSRRPDALMHAQFWGEDGTVFFADAYNLGWWPALFQQFAGYFEVFPRLGSALALLVPLTSAPLLLNVIAIMNQAIPVSLLLSARSSAWGSLRFRAVLGGVYLATPNAWELIGTIANSQWFLVVSAFLLLVASKPHTVMARVFDICVLAVCGLSGPFCIILFPISAFIAWRERDGWRWIEAGILATTCIVQGLGLLSGGIASRSHPPFGASTEMLTRVLAGQLYLGSMLGNNGLAARGGVPTFIFLAFVAVSGTVLLAIYLFRSALRIKLFFLVSVLILVSSLIAPRFGGNNGLTVLMHMARGSGLRYWFFPSLAIEWLILWHFENSRVLMSRIVSAVLLLVFCFGVLLRWQAPAFQNMHFADYARRFESAPPGTVMVIPENPSGWKLQLIKHTQ